MAYQKPIDNYTPGFQFSQKYPYTPYFIWVGLAGKPHKGIDYICAINTPVKAPCKLQQARIYTDQVIGGVQHPDYGRSIYAYSLENPDITLVFGHLMAVGIPRVGKIWQKGEIFAWSGNTGKSTKPHLHYENRRNNIPINPNLFF